MPVLPVYTFEDMEELDDAPDAEVEETEENVVDQATAARTIAELQAEIEMLRHWRRWPQGPPQRHRQEVGRALHAPPEPRRDVRCAWPPPQDGHLQRASGHAELLGGAYWLALGAPEALVTIHGGMGREERRKAQEAFTQDKEVEILIATDAASEGINLQRGHLMVNYDLPWNPNRLEQRFGRIHRIGQTEVCHLWNLVAKETREGEVYQRLLEKLDEERRALGGQVFDILGRLTFDNRPLRELLLEAIRYGDRPEVRARLTQVVENAFDRDHLKELIEDRALTGDTMDVTRVRAIREEMERADARRLQPHFIASFFLEAFKLLGGKVHEREPKRYEITHVPAVIRNRDRQIGRGDAVLQRYERISFEKELIAVPGKPLAAFVCPGHPLLEATIDLIIERNRDLLKRGAVLVDEADPGEEVRTLVYLEHAIQDARVDRSGQRRIVSKQMQFVEIDNEGNTSAAGYAPYLNYRPLSDDELGILSQDTGAYVATQRTRIPRPGIRCPASRSLAFGRASSAERGSDRQDAAAVHERLTKEINYWDHRAVQLKEQELAGRTNARLNSGLARQRADDLTARLQRRMAELEQERKLSPLPPVVLGAALVVPHGLMSKLRGHAPSPPTFAADTKRSEQLAVCCVLDTERRLGYVPRDVSVEKLGYDVESSIPNTGRLRFIEVKGRIAGARTVTITSGEIRTGLNKPEEFILAIVEIDGDGTTPRYIRQPFQREPDFGVTSVNYDLAELLERSEQPA